MTINWPLLVQGLAEIAVGLMGLVAWCAMIFMSVRALWSVFENIRYAAWLDIELTPIRSLWSEFRNVRLNAAWYDNEVFPLMDEDPRSWELSPMAHARLRRRAIEIARFGVKMVW
jgi:hypothetical protein